MELYETSLGIGTQRIPGAPLEEKMHEAVIGRNVAAHGRSSAAKDMISLFTVSELRTIQRAIRAFPNSLITVLDLRVAALERDKGSLCQLLTSDSAEHGGHQGPRSLFNQRFKEAIGIAAGV